MGAKAAQEGGERLDREGRMRNGTPSPSEYDREQGRRLGDRGLEAATARIAARIGPDARVQPSAKASPIT